MKYNSKIRDEIKDIVVSSRDHLSADEVYKILLAKDSSTSFSTVYRNLHQLTEAGILLELEMPDGKVHYDGDLSNHYHGYCISCKKIIDIKSDEVDTSKLAGNVSMMKVLSCDLLFKGICKECMQND